jgi:hypothetical protein
MTEGMTREQREEFDAHLRGLNSDEERGRRRALVRGL